MSILAMDNGKTFKPAPEGLQRAVCADVVDLGMVETQWGQKHKVRIVWQSEEIESETGKPFQVAKMYTLGLGERTNLRKDLEMWRGRRFTAEELKGFDLEKLLGVNCQLQIVHSPSDDGKVYANIQAIIPLSKGMQKLTVAPDFVRHKDRIQDAAKLQPSGTDSTVYADDIPF